MGSIGSVWPSRRFAALRAGEGRTGTWEECRRLLAPQSCIRSGSMREPLKVRDVSYLGLYLDHDGLSGHRERRRMAHVRDEHGQCARHIKACLQPSGGAMRPDKLLKFFKPRMAYLNKCLGLQDKDASSTTKDTKRRIYMREKELLSEQWSDDI